MELISVIIPVYNAEKTIEKCVYSIIRGEYQNIEVIVVDDGSTDKTARILDKIATEDNRVIVIHQPNGGVAKARNTGLDHAHGEFIAWCDADDYVEPEWLQRQWKTQKKYNADIVVCNCIIENENKSMQNNGIEQEGFVELDRKGAINAFLEHKILNGILWDKLFRSELFKEIRLDSQIHYHEDDMVIWECLQVVNRIVRTPFTDYHFVINKNSLMGSKINTKRIYDDLFVWKYIYEESQKQGIEFGKIAEETYLGQIIGCTTLLYRGKITPENKEGYKQLKKVVRGMGLKKMKKIKGVKNKVLYCSLYFGIKIPSFLYRLGDRYV